MGARKRGFAMLIAVALVAGCSGGSSTAVRKTTTTVPVPHLLPGPTSYHVVYRVEVIGPSSNVVSTDDLWVRRPFDSQLEHRSGEPPGTPGGNLTVSSFGRFSSTSPSSMPLEVAVNPGVASGDLRLDATLADLVRTGWVRATSQRRTVLGRACVVYRTGEPIGTGDLHAPTTTDHADECVDERGLVLQEEWTASGTLLRRRSAVSVDLGGAPPAGVFAPLPLNPSTGAGGASVTALALDGQPTATFWELTDLPGFEHRGRYAVRPASTTPDPAGGLAPSPPASIADVWVRDGDVVIIEQGDHTLDPSPPPAVARTVDGGRLPHAVLIVGAYANVVRAQADVARSVRVTATLPASELLALVRRLRPTR